jgi:hypothetical protein
MLRVGFESTLPVFKRAKTVHALDRAAMWSAFCHPLRPILRAIAQAVSRWLPTATARVRAQVWSCGICSGHNGTGAGFLHVLRFPLPNFIPPSVPQSPSSIIWGWYNRPVVAAVASGLSLNKPKIIIINRPILRIHIGENWWPQLHTLMYFWHWNRRLAWVWQRSTDGVVAPYYILRMSSWGIVSACESELPTSQRWLWVQSTVRAWSVADGSKVKGECLAP